MTSSTFYPDTERDALLILNAVPGLGNRRILQLIDHYGNAQEIFRASVQELAHQAGLQEAVCLSLAHFSTPDFLKGEERRLTDRGARVMTIRDPDYPQSLKTIPDAPIVLYLLGKLPQRLDCALAIVGSRNPTLYGLETAERLSRELAELGVPIISGLARGIDASAHKGCLAAGGETVGVLGCGLDVIYPPENAGLYAKIRDKGCIISEFPFGTPPVSFNFPRRNRIVSGLSLGVVVVEARGKSGALITAEFALDQGREVFAVPGRIDSCLSEGPHALIRQGAKLVLSVEDILQELPVQVVKPQGGPKNPSDSEKGLEGDEKVLFQMIEKGPTSLDALEAGTGRFPSSLMGPLLSLQVKRLIRELPGKVYELFGRRE